METFDIAAVVTTFALLLGYHVYFYRVGLSFLFPSGIGVKGDKSTTSGLNDWQYSRTRQNAIYWITKHTEKQDPASVTLAIQTLRNTILVAIFVGGQSFIYAVNSLENITSAEDPATITRSAILSSFLFLSFLCWANVIRFASHMSYFIGVPTEHHKANLKRLSFSESAAAAVGTGTVSQTNGSLTAEPVQPGCLETNPSIPPSQRSESDINDEIRNSFHMEGNRMAHLMLMSFSFGFRFIFVSIPYFFYALGPIALVISTAVVLLFLYYIEPSNVFKPEGQH